jgi:glutamyl-tRNA synthetase
MKTPVRVRFAPSPTGSLHIGGVRTALYNYLLAKQTGGTFIIRIEDTDQNRFVPGAEEYIIEALKWCGITPDEGILEGGPYAPYRQSERTVLYKQYAMQLLESGNAYYAFDTVEELDSMRERLKAAHVPDPKYNSISRMSMKNSFTLSKDEVQMKLDAGIPYVIRLNVSKKEEVRFDDLVRGHQIVHSSTLDDKILMKSDGLPTYHLANVVDDYLMKITHVIRGEEWLPSAPIHVLLYKALGWENSMPLFTHLPLILKPDGKGKLSKRDGKLFGFPVFPLQCTQLDKETGIIETVLGFREEGYLPEAIINFLVLLGWNPGTKQEIFSFDEMVNLFTLERINKSGARFDINKAKWFNQYYLRQKPNTEFVQYLLEDLSKNNITSSQIFVEQVVNLVKENVVFSKDFWLESKFMFVQPTTYDEKIASTKWDNEVVQILTDYQAVCILETDFSPENIKTIFHKILENRGFKTGKILQCIRLAITGKSTGPDIMQIISILGNTETQKRISNAITNLNKYIIT